MQNSACLTTFLSAMLIGLNVISSSSISKLTGQKVASFLSHHFLFTPLFSLQLKTCCFYLAYTCEEALWWKVWWKYYRWGREKWHLAHLNICKVLSMLEDAATFDQANILILNLPQWVKRLPLDFSKGNGKGTMRGVSLHMTQTMD